MPAFVKIRRGVGDQQTELNDTPGGVLGGKIEAARMVLKGSVLLMGVK